MATIAGTITGLNCLSKPPNTGGAGREVWEMVVSFAAYTGASDDASIAGVGAACTASMKDGLTRTLRSGSAGKAGADTADQAVYSACTTVSTDALTGNLAVAAGTEITSATASTGVTMIVIVDAA